MKLFPFLAVAGLALAGAAAPTVAAPRAHTRVLATRVHGPLRVLPHHKTKYCRYRTVKRYTTKKCWYH